MKKIDKEFVIEAIKESIGEVSVRHLTKARLDGQKSFRVRITFSELAKLVKERIDGLNGEWLSNGKFVPSGFVAPSKAELRDIWLPMAIGWPYSIVGWPYSIDSKGIEFDLEVPPPRKMHAR